MKKFYLFRNSLLPLLGALAVMCAVSCSQEILEVPEDLMPQNDVTRANNFEISLIADPVGVGPRSEYFAQNRVYDFETKYDRKNLILKGGEITAVAIEGSDDAIELTPQGFNFASIRFKAPGSYLINARLELVQRVTGPGLRPVMVRTTSMTCRVPSFTSNITGPTSVILGGEYNFKLTYANPDYPDPILKITETVFNDPQYTILSNDGAGNYRIRFNQPGDYTIEPGVGWDNPAESTINQYSPSYHVKVFFRPEMKFSRGELRVSGEGIEDTLLSYLNFIELCDIQHIKYTSLPFRVFFKYSLSGFIPTLEDQEPVQVPDIHGEIRQLAGMGGDVMLPNTTPDVPVRGLYYADVSSFFPRRGYYWEITIPRDTCYLKTCIAQIGGPIFADPDGPIIITPTD